MADDSPEKPTDPSDDKAKASLLDVPEIKDAPTGAVTLGEKAGTFGPWLAIQTVQMAAEEIARKCSISDQACVLVVGDRALINGAATTRQVRDHLARLERRLQSLPTVLAAAASRLPDVSHLGIRLEAAAEAGGEAVVEDESAPTPSATLGAALGLLSLARTDYTVTAAQVNPPPSLLVTLTAAALARKSAHPTVEVDGFTAAGTSPSLDAASRVADARDVGLSSLALLEALLAPTESGLTAMRTRLSHLEDSWEAWATAKDARAEGGTDLRGRIEQLSHRVAELAKIAGPARSIADDARSTLAEADSTLAALLQKTDAAEAPLVTAIRWERLRAASRSSSTPVATALTDTVPPRTAPRESPPSDVAQALPDATAHEDTVAVARHAEAQGTRHIDYVLYVSTDYVGADAITRRSVLGTSGRLTFLGSAAASWLLLNVQKGSIEDGGWISPAKRLLFDLESGNSGLDNLDLNGQGMKRDPLRRSETAATVTVLLIAAFLGIIAIVAALRLVLG